MLTQKYISRILRDKAARKKVSYIIFALSLMVVCCVSWQLRLNAITMSETPICGYTEHIHNESCIEDERLICLLDELGPHIHSDEEACYEYNEILQCEDKEHEHVESCWGQEQTLVCSQTECHEHNEECYDVQDEEILTCELAECHVHTDNCYEKVYSCEFPEHQHDSSCYEKVEEETVQNATDDLLESAESTKNTEEDLEWNVQSSYNVHFWGFDFGTGRSPLGMVTVDADETVTPPELGEAPSGYEWNGKWYTNSSCTEEFVFDFNMTVGEFAEVEKLEGNDISLYPGLERIYSVIFNTNYGTRIPALSLREGDEINLDAYTPTKDYYIFAGWYADKELTEEVSGIQTITSDVTFYAKWDPGMVGFNPIRRIEEINSDSFAVENSMGTWYAMVGSTIYVESTYNDKGEGTHAVMWRLGDQTGEVTSDIGGTTPVYLDDVYEDYYLYNNENEEWTEVFGVERNPYSDTRIIQNTGVTKIYFDYMRARADLILFMENYEPTSTGDLGGGYYDFYSLKDEGLLTGTVTVTDAGNTYAEGVTPSGLHWTYEPAEDYADGLDNVYTIYNIKIDQTIDAYTEPASAKLYLGKYPDYSMAEWSPIENQYMVNTIKLDELTKEMIMNTAGRGIKDSSWELAKSTGGLLQLQIYALQRLPGQNVDFVIGSNEYTVYETKQTAQGAQIYPKSFSGCSEGRHAGTGHMYRDDITRGYTVNEEGALEVVNQSNGNLVPTEPAYTLIDLSKAQELAEIAAKEQSVDLTDVSYVQIFYYDRINFELTFNLNYDADGDEQYDTVVYEDILYGTPLEGYQDGGSEIGDLLNRPGWKFMGWTLADGGSILSESDWGDLSMPNHDRTLFAVWDQGEFLVEFYDDREENWKDGTTEADHLLGQQWLNDGELAEYPYIDGNPIYWVWDDQEDSGVLYRQFVFEEPLYRESGMLNEDGVHVIKVYAVWIEPVEATTSFTIKKVWNDSKEEHDPVTVQIYAGGNVVGQEIRIGEAGDWTVTVDNLPYYDEYGNVISYTVVEESVDGYYAEYGAVEINQATGDDKYPTYSIQITNTAGYRLPETGGDGVYWYYLMGMGLMVVPVICRLKKKNLFEIVKK